MTEAHGKCEAVRMVTADAIKLFHTYGDMEGLKEWLKQQMAEV